MRPAIGCAMATCAVLPLAYVLSRYDVPVTGVTATLVVLTVCSLLGIGGWLGKDDDQ